MKRKFYDGEGIETQPPDELSHSDRLLAVHPSTDSDLKQATDPLLAHENSQSSVSKVQARAPLLRVRVNGSVQPEASIVLIGMRGVGKSTLAVIGATALRWRLVDQERCFQATTGSSPLSFIRREGWAKYRLKDSQTLCSMLAEHSKSCIIVCSSGCVESEDNRVLLRQYAQTHPVIHVVRDAESIGRYLGDQWTGKVEQLRRAREPGFRISSNLEFYNIHDTRLPSNSDSTNEKLKLFSTDTLIPVSLTLKDVEQDFLRFIKFVTCRQFSRTVEEPAVDDGTLDPPELRDFSYFLPLLVPSITTGSPNLRELESCVDALEFRVDFLEDPKSSTAPGCPEWDHISEQFAYLRRKTRTPIIYHVARGRDAISHYDDQDIDLYFDLLRGGLRLGAEYLMLQLGVDDGAARMLIEEKGPTKVIGYYHDNVNTSSQGWDGQERFDLYLKAKNLGCDIVQLSQPALRLSDNFAIHQFLHRVSKLPTPRPVISAFNTGRLGRTSKCFNTSLTPVYHPSLGLSEEWASKGEITVQQAQKALFDSFIYEKFQYFTIGTNVAYSLVPALHNAAFQAYGMAHEFFKRQTPTMSEVNDLLQSPLLGGISLSLPWKRGLLDRLDSLSNHAKAIGAVNMVIPIRKLKEKASQGQDDAEDCQIDVSEQHSPRNQVLAFHGDNTDWIGIRTVVLRYLSPANAICSNTTALVLGAGGMARAAIYAMIKSGVRHVFIHNRTYANAVQVAQHFNDQQPTPLSDLGDQSKQDEQESHNPTTQGPPPARVVVLESLENCWPDTHRSPTIIINCIPAPEANIASISISNRGKDNRSRLEVPYSWMTSPTGGVFLELSYKPPLYSEQLRRVHTMAYRGWFGVSGLEVLPEQAYAQFERWTGRKAPRMRMKDAMIKSLLADEQYSSSLEPLK